MDEGVGASAASVGAFGCADFYFAVALRDSGCGSGFSDIDDFGLVDVVGVAHFI